MKCINKGLMVIVEALLLAAFLCGCKNSYDIPYDVNSDISAYRLDESGTLGVLDSFASDICVVNDDVNASSAELTSATAGALFNITTKETEFAKEANLKLHPASTTKVMTAYIALKHGRLDDILTASSNVEIKEKGAQLCGFKEGDKATLEQVLNALLIYSANDAGVMIAEYVSGSVDAFANLMNEEALKLGCTNTHFVNPHGLTDDEHLTTAYDLYLIFNAALKYDKFKEIISKKDYQLTWSSKDGSAKKKDISNTNRFIIGKFDIPDGVSVIGGKTGTTGAAGGCLLLYSQNTGSKDEYISVVMKADPADTMYDNMYSLLLLEN